MKKLEPLTRVEGEGRLVLKIKDGIIEDAYLNIFEPPRFFESILVGRKYHSIMDITARICGICPIAYQMSSVQAVESLFDVDIPLYIEDLRRLFYYGEWIQSHILHIFFLHLPDFLGVSSIFEINKINPEIVKNALKLKNFSGKLVEIIGGRVSHPVNVKVGGFYKLPKEEEFNSIIEEIDDIYNTSLKLFDYISKLDYPDYDFGDFVFVSLIDRDNYPILKGDIYISDKTVIKKEEFLDYFQEYEVPHSNAKFCKMKDGRHYIVGPIARFNNSFEKLLPETQILAKQYGITPPVKNPYKSILVRMIEVIDCIQRIKDKVKNYRDYEKASVDYSVKPGVGFGVSEAPRGILWHMYRIDEDGVVKEANIIPPTSQNQYAMESDVKRVVIGLPDYDASQKIPVAEKLIRNYDPCISCATHFLKVETLNLDNR